MNRFRIGVILAVLTVLLLSACASAAAPTSAAPTAAAPASTAAATSAPAVAAANSKGMRTFVIVPDQTTASYEVQEKFLNRSLPNQAIGKTNAVQGQVQISLNGKPNAQIPQMTVDLRTLTSDQARRDNMIRRNWLASDQYPTATFVSTGIQGAPDTYTEGQQITFKLTGNMTIHDVTKPVTFDVTAKVTGGMLTGTAKTQILMKDFGFDPPDIANMLTVKDGVTVTVDFTAKEQM